MTYQSILGYNKNHWSFQEVKWMYQITIIYIYGLHKAAKIERNREIESEIEK